MVEKVRKVKENRYAIMKGQDIETVQEIDSVNKTESKGLANQIKKK